MKDVFPAISVSRKLGELVDEVTFDYPALTSYLRDNGFSDEQILNTSICVNTEEDTPGQHRNNSSEDYTMHGGYDITKLGNNILLFPSEKLSTAQKLQDEGRTYNNADPSDGVSDFFSRVLVHEIEHHTIHTLEGGMKYDSLRYSLGRRGLSAAKMGGGILIATETARRVLEGVMQVDTADKPIAHMVVVAVALATGIKKASDLSRDYNYYYNSPEEIRCRQAEQHTPDNLVQFRLKNSPPASS